MLTHRQLFIRQGRNPVVEAALQERGEVFIPNDANLDEKKMRAMLITGPNMGGKSCYMYERTRFLLVAHTGHPQVAYSLFADGRWRRSRSSPRSDRLCRRRSARSPRATPCSPGAVPVTPLTVR